MRLGGQHADRQLERRRLGQAIRRALAKLGPQQRAALVLREYYGLSYEEIARACDVESGTVKSRLSRAGACWCRCGSQGFNGAR